MGVHRRGEVIVPFYEYTANESPGCPHCLAGFTVLQRLRDPVLSACPQCGTAIRRVISPPSLVSGQSDLKPSRLEQAGFTQYRKIGKGVYEKTAGKGPGVISAD
ncbi:MAG: zinc ribbon domain-containing protein [Wenzhouxiangella sp.]|nr:MAG: zinc ribbon domain-containing protein [Wenzhouxiangella sp.]